MRCAAKCYLHLYLDVTKSPPVVDSVGLSSEPPESLTVPIHKIRALDLGSIEHQDYHLARRDMLTRLTSAEWYLGQEWLRPFVEAFLAREGGLKIRRRDGRSELADWNRRAACGPEVE